MKNEISFFFQGERIKSIYFDDGISFISTKYLYEEKEMAHTN